MALWDLESDVHEIGTAEALALEVERTGVDAIELMDGVCLVRVKSCHLNAREVLVHECLELPPVEHCLILVFAHIHHRCEVLTSIRREETVEVAKLHDRTDLLVVGNSLAAQILLFVGHVLWLDLHSEASAHGNVDAELERCGAESLMVWCSRDVTCHGNGRVEVRCSPLHAHTLQSIGIVAHPELIEVREQAVVDTSATRSTVLNDHIRIFLTYALAGLDQAFVVFDVEV